MSQYRVLADLFVMPGSIYAQAGSVISDAPGGILPANWQPPTGAVDPVDTPAINAYFAVGPRGQSGAEPNLWNYPFGFFRWSNVSYGPAVHYWYSDGHGQFLLKGAENLGTKPPTV